MKKCECDIQKLVNLRSEHVSEKVNEGKSEVWQFLVGYCLMAKLCLS